MLAPGVRVVRGPDWIWQNQGNSIIDYSILLIIIILFIPHSSHSNSNYSSVYFVVVVDLM